MTDLRKLAEGALNKGKRYGPEVHAGYCIDFRDATHPQAILELLDRVDALRAAHRKILEIWTGDLPAASADTVEVQMRKAVAEAKRISTAALQESGDD